MIDDERRKIADDRNVIRQYENQDLDDLLKAWAAASEIAHPFLSQEFLATERDNIPNLYLPNMPSSWGVRCEWVAATGRFGRKYT